jgi:hypothetical protein
MNTPELMQRYEALKATLRAGGDYSVQHVAGYTSEEVATACHALLDEAQDDRDEAARWDAIMAYQHAALDRSEH